MSEFCEHCDWWFRDPSPVECPGCEIVAVEAERDRLRELVRDGGFLLTAYCNQADVPYGVARLADRFCAALEEGGDGE